MVSFDKNSNEIFFSRLMATTIFIGRYAHKVKDYLRKLFIKTTCCMAFRPSARSRRLHANLISENRFIRRIPYAINKTLFSFSQKIFIFHLTSFCKLSYSHCYCRYSRKSRFLYIGFILPNSQYIKK